MRLLLLGLVMLALGQARALADPAPATPAVDKVKVAKQYVDAGLAAQNTGDYDTALTMYAKAYELVPHPLLFFNMAQAHRLAGHIEEALKLYTRYLAEDPKGAQAPTARELVAELKARRAKTKAKAGGAEDDQPPGDVAKTKARKSASEPTEGGQAGGTLVVKARNHNGDVIANGTVMIDEEPKGKLIGGKLTVPEVAEGRHTVAIEAGGYQRFEETVTVRDGERARLDALLLDKVAPSSSSHHTAWKVSLGASAVVAATGITLVLVGYSRFGTLLSHDELQVMGDAGATVSSDDCGTSYQTILDNSNPTITSFNYSALQSACTWKSRIYLGYVMGSVGVVGAVVSLIMLTRDSGAPETTAAGTLGKKSEVAFTPIVMPGGGGASLSLAW